MTSPQTSHWDHVNTTASDSDPATLQQRLRPDHIQDMYLILNTTIAQLQPSPVIGKKQSSSTSAVNSLRQSSQLASDSKGDDATASTTYLSQDPSQRNLRKKPSSSTTFVTNQDTRPLILHPHIHRVHEARPSSRPNSVQQMPQLFTPRALSSTTEPLLLDSSASRIKKDSVRSGPTPERPHSRHSVQSHSSRGAPCFDTQERGKDKDRLTPEKSHFFGPIAVAEFERMRKEIETLKKSVHDTKRAAKKQTKKIEELKAELSTSAQISHEQEFEIGRMKTQCRMYEELVSSIESSIQCQICMELPLKPFALTPCGHVFCLSCLQEWFKTTPGMDGDDEDSWDPNDVKSRKKTCPCCRTVVRHRPSPIFMIKAVATAILKEKKPPALRGGDPAPSFVDDDPWKDIFLSSDEDEDENEDEESDDDDDDELTEAETEAWMYMLQHGRRADLFEDVDSSDSEQEHHSVEGDSDEDSTDEEYDSADYVLPRWEPPTVNINPVDYDFSQENRECVLGLLRRGCSWEMIQNFALRYSHRHGIIVSLRSIDHLYASDDDDFDDHGVGREGMHQVFLGWNIQLDEGDVDGEAFMHQILCDIRDYPERWRLIPKYDGQGSVEVRKLVRDDRIETFSTTDTEGWLDSDSNDMDVD